MCDMTQPSDIIIRTGTEVGRTAATPPDAVDEAATWLVRYDQAQQRIAALEKENGMERILRTINHALAHELNADLLAARRSARAWKRAAKLYACIAQVVSTPWEVESARRSYRDARHGRPVLTNQEYQTQWWKELEANEQQDQR